MRPVYIEEKCKQCGLCFPVCLKMQFSK
ncbi:MAG: 4Fe-4S binding protein [Clostridia bacterium]